MSRKLERVTEVALALAPPLMLTAAVTTGLIAVWTVSTDTQNRLLGTSAILAISAMILTTLVNS